MPEILFVCGHIVCLVWSVTCVKQLIHQHNESLKHVASHGGGQECGRLVRYVRSKPELTLIPALAPFAGRECHITNMTRLEKKPDSMPRTGVTLVLGEYIAGSDPKSEAVSLANQTRIQRYDTRRNG